jgi:hypothetical protein
MGCKDEWFKDKDWLVKNVLEESFIASSKAGYYSVSSWDSSVGIATGSVLEGQGSIPQRPDQI